MAGAPPVPGVDVRAEHVTFLRTLRNAKGEAQAVEVHVVSGEKWTLAGPEAQAFLDAWEYLVGYHLATWCPNERKEDEPCRSSD